MRKDVIEQILPVGVQLLGARPNDGLEALVRSYVEAVALGVAAQGHQARAGEVLYVAGAETRAAIQRQFAPGPPVGVRFKFEMPAGVYFSLWLRHYLQAYPQTRLVVISALERVLPMNSPWEQEQAARVLVELAHKYDVAVLVLRTLRIVEADGSRLGVLSFVAHIDSLATLVRSHRDGRRRLRVTSRKAEIDVEVA